MTRMAEGARTLELYGGVAPWEEDAGGGQVVADRLLEALGRRGWRARGVFLVQDPAAGVPPSVKYEASLVRKRPRPISDALALARRAGGGSAGATLVHVSSPSAFLAARLAGRTVPVVATCHHYDPPPLPRLISPRGLRTLRSLQQRWMDRALLRGADRVVAVSASSLEKLAAGGYLDPRVPTTVIHNGVGREWLAVEGGPRMEGGGRALFVGRLDAQKGVDVLLRALARTASIRLELVGSGIQEAEYRKMAGELGVGDRVRFLGRLEPDQVRRRMGEADFLVLPSRAESFGLVALEAMAAGRPVVASRVGALPEFVEDDRVGVLVPPDDPVALAAAMDRLVADPDRAMRLGRAGRRAARERTWERVAGRYEEVYAEMLEGAAAASGSPG